MTPMVILVLLVSLFVVGFDFTLWHSCVYFANLTFSCHFISVSSWPLLFDDFANYYQQQQQKQQSTAK